MNFSYWEHKTWLQNIDFTIIGSGLIGLSAAIELRQKFPNAKIIVLEKGMLPQGASTKNAGFACFGSLSEILADFKNHTSEEVFNLVEKRRNGLQLLKENLGVKNIGFQQHGGYELFLNSKNESYLNCLDNLDRINQFLKPIFKESAYKIINNPFGFQKTQEKAIFCPEEGQINTGGMMITLLKKVALANIYILNAVTVESFTENESGVTVKTNKLEFNTNKLLIATNGFASQLGIKETIAARAQVLITKPIKNLSIKGTFHLDEGYYYFRNIDNRILFGGGRNLDFKTEETTSFGRTEIVQQALEKLLQEVILPNTPFEIEHRWSGIMGVGSQKKPIVKQLSNHVFCGVRLGGLGIAIGSLVGKELADLL